VHKSFFQSPVLQPDTMKSILLQGLEQAVDTRLPEILVHHRFKPFVEDVVPGLPQGSRLLAHPAGESSLADLYRQGRVNTDVVLAVGPEGGWIDYEIQSFTDRGFIPFSVGRRILHVDTAVVVLLSQLQVLRELAAA